MDRRKLALGATMLTMLLTFICINSGRTQAAIPAHIPIDGIFKPSIGVDSSVQAGGIVQVTPDSQNKKGAIWSEEQYKIDLTHNFTSLMYVNLGDKKAQSGDGMAFVMMNDPDKVKNWQQVTGGALGVWRNPFSWVKDNSAIAKSFAVEFDTYHNGNDFDGLLPNDGPDRGHVAYNFPGQDSAYQRLPSRLYALNHLQLQKPQNGDYLSNGTWHPFRVKWDSLKKQLTYQFDDYAPVTVAIDPATVFGTNQVYWGVTGSTGDYSELNQVVFSEIPGLNSIDSPVTMTDLEKTTPTVSLTNNQAMQTSQLYVGRTVHYSITQTNLPTNTEDIDQLVANIQLGLTTYKPGTLKVDGVSQPDSHWKTGKQLQQAVGSLTQHKMTARIEFDATVDQIDVSKAQTASATDQFTYNAKSLMDKQFKMPYTVTNDFTQIVINNNPQHRITAYELGKMKAMQNAQDVVRELVRIGNIAQRYSDKKPISTDQITTKTDALAAIKNLTLGKSLIISFIANEPGMSAVSSVGIFIVDSDTGSLTRPFTSTDGKHQLLANLEYLKPDGSGPIAITNTATPIAAGDNRSDPTTTITNQWTDKTGLALTNISNGNYPGDYTGELTWTLSDVPH